MDRKTTSYKVTTDTRARLVELATSSGKSQSEMLEAAVQVYRPDPPMNAVTTVADRNPVDTSFMVDPSPQAPVDLSAPLWQLWTHPFRAWNPDALLMAKDQADQGNMQFVADLWESMLADDRVSGALEQRILASEGLPQNFIGSPSGVKKLEALWTKILSSPGLRAEIFRWGMGPGICPVYVREWVDGEPEGIEVWHPRWLRYYWWERRWKVLCMSGLVDVASQPGRWYLFCPFGQPLSRPWVTGLWYSIATWWLTKAYAIPDMNNYGQTRATPKWFMTVMDGNASISRAEKAQAITWLAKIPQRSSMFVPYPFKVDQYDSTSTGWQIYLSEIDKANTAVAQRILGHDGAMEKSSTHASGEVAKGVRSDLIAYDCRAETEFWRTGLLTTWAQVQGIEGDVPYPERQTTEPEDLELVSKVQLAAAQAFVALDAQGLTADLDMRANLGRYFIMRDAQTGEADDTLPDGGVQLTAAEFERLPASCVVRLDQRSGRATLLSGKRSSKEQRRKDVREHARDGLGFRDAVADQLLEADLCKPIAVQVEAILREAHGYEDAKRKLSAAFPDFDRKRLRDMLTGGLLLTQAAGRLSGGRESHSEKPRPESMYSGRGDILLDQYKRDDDGRFATTGAMHTAGKSSSGSHAASDGGPLPDHIQALKLPPAWHDVKYNPDPHADLQAIGRDSKGRAQYVYSEKFSNKQAEAKFSRIEEMRSKFDDIKAQNDHSRKSENPVTKDSADAIHVIMHTGIRPGSEHDTGAEKQAYGATTLKAEHVHVAPDGSVSLKFVGKKGVDLDIPIKDEVSARILKTRRESAGGPDKQLFPKATDASLRDLTHTYDGGNFKTKDFRTHHGTSLAYKEVAGRPHPKTQKEYEKATKEVATIVSKALGNTPIVAMQSYINPAVFQGWKSGLKD